MAGSERLTPQQAQRVQYTRSLVEKVVNLLPASAYRLMEREELVAVGDAALVEAARTFEPGRGVPFEGYAWPRVHGAVANALGKERRRMLDCLQAARAALGSFLEEREQEGNILTDTEEQVLGQAQRLENGTLATMFSAFAGAASRTAANGTDEAVVLRAMYARALDVLESTLRDLDEREQTLVRMHYVDGIDMREVSRVLGIGYATVRRWHVKVMEKLGAALREAGLTRSALPV